jgi:hypothetical protein
MGAMQYIASVAASTQQGPRDWLRQTAGAAVPSGSSAVREATSVGVIL